MIFTILLIYSLFLNTDLSKADFKRAKKRFNLHGLVEIHHIIPRQFKNHPTIKFSNYDIEKGYNLMFLPTIKGKNKLNLHDDRPIHTGGHIAYNYYLKGRLDMMLELEKIKKEDMYDLNMNLKQELRQIKDIPWRNEYKNKNKKE
jgi:hypothetical protein